jgi:hypothetical protein
MRKPSKVQKIVELRLAGGSLPVTSCLQADAVARSHRRPDPVPQFDHPLTAFGPVGLDQPDDPACLPVKQPKPAFLEPAGGKARHARKYENAPLRMGLHSQLCRKSGLAQIKAALRISQNGGAIALIDPALRLVQRFGQAAQFGAERPR